MELTNKSISYGNLNTFNQEIQKRYAKKEDIEPISEAEILALFQDETADGQCASSDNGSGMPD